MKLVMTFGAVYKLTNAEYRAMLEAVKEQGCVPELPHKRLVGVDCVHITDMTADEADELLDELKGA